MPPPSKSALVALIDEATGKSADLKARIEACHPNDSDAKTKDAPECSKEMKELATAQAAIKKVKSLLGACKKNAKSSRRP